MNQKNKDGGCKTTLRNPGRREFLRKSAYIGTALAFGPSIYVTSMASSEDALPMRVLGRTGVKVTILGLGTAPVGEGPVGVQEGIKIFSEAIDRGVNYIDTARIYGNAEEILGHIVPKRRDKLFLVTKVWTDDGQKAESLLSESLRQLKTDYVDLVHIHNVGGKDIDKVLAKDGVLEYLRKEKERGKIRFIGVTSHCRPGRVAHMLETGQIDVAMTVINYADKFTYGFHEKILPAAKKHNVALSAMKVYVGIKGGFPNHRRGYVGCVTEQGRMPDAIAYVLDLEGINVAVVGPYTVEQSIQNVDFAKRYKPLSSEQRARLQESGRQMATELGTRYGPLI
ncbi:MAG: aldo/keto reductase [Sedimentisphaerales bacterium]|nr:aldo/keto reductase [Sedimentisphaerales bacterium]